MKLLIADDSSIIRKSLKRLLLTLNNHIQVFESGNVKQTLDLFQELNPDLIILDIMLPDGNGIDALKVIKQQKPAQKVMIYTAYPDALNRKKCEEAGADYFFDKADDIAIIHSKVKELHQHSKDRK
ncbi:MAG: response regulator [Bacteroidetes bacterium]|nr:response regulator [Bacteroidota bacterium]